MAHQPLDGQQVGALLQVVRGKRVPERVRGVGLFDVGRAVPRIGANGPHCSYAKVRAFPPGPFKKVIPRFVLPVIVPQNRKQYRRKRDFALFQTFAFLDVHLHALTVDVGKFDVHAFRHPGPGGINEHNNGPVLKVANRTQHIGYFVFRQHQREGFGYFGRWEVFLCLRQLADGKCL